MAPRNASAISSRASLWGAGLQATSPITTHHPRWHGSSLAIPNGGRIGPTITTPSAKTRSQGIWRVDGLQVRDSPIKQYSFSSHFLRVAIGAVATAVLLLGGYALAVGLDGYSRVRTSRLETRNQALRTEFEQFQRRIELLESTLDDVAANDARFRGIAGLESIDPEVLQAGVGGPGLGSDPVDPSHRGLEEQLVTTRPSRLGTLPQGRDGRRVAPPADSMASSFYYTRSRGGA